jgi:hypothetical protein
LGVRLNRSASFTVNDTGSVAFPLREQNTHKFSQRNSSLFPDRFCCPVVSLPPFLRRVLGGESSTHFVILKSLPCQGVTRLKELSPWRSKIITPSTESNWVGKYYQKSQLLWIKRLTESSNLPHGESSNRKPPSTAGTPPEQSERSRASSVSTALTMANLALHETSSHSIHPEEFSRRVQKVETAAKELGFELPRGWIEEMWLARGMLTPMERWSLEK